ncbi:MAG: D-aminoacylase [Gemmatimonadota bacterium]|nr:D-aminoacylase [Gemmatimonadota bacterium]
MSICRRAWGRAAALGLLAACAGAVGGTPRPAPLIVNATVVDGTGAEPRGASVRIRGDRILALGDLRPEPEDSIVNGAGLVLAPGFIDTHSHADGDIFDHRDALAAVSQGITTAVVGQDGGSADTLATLFARLARTPPAINFASYVGHNTVRARVMGPDYRRRATADEVSRMQALVGQGMGDGALGLSTGLEYDPGIYSDRTEVLALARTAAEFGGRYISHLRSEDRGFWDAVDEIIAIGRTTGMPVQISHTKLAMRSLWGQADSLLGVLDRARAAGVNITADIYPYTYWQSNLAVLLPERNFDDRAAVQFALDQLAPPDGLLLSLYAPEPSYVGKTVAEIARLRETDPTTAYLDLIRRSEAFRADRDRRNPAASSQPVDMVIGTSMVEPDLERIMAWPFTNFCTDGSLVDRHPRGIGSYPRVLGRYVRERHVLSLTEAVRKLSGLAAANVGLGDRGTIAPGTYADLVLFDPATVADRADREDPRALSVGIRTVWVNGRVVYQDGRTTGVFPGRVVRRGVPPNPPSRRLKSPPASPAE